MFTFVLLALAGIAVGSILVSYWENIRSWLNTTAADTVERTLGYKARQSMLKAVSIADRTFRVLKGSRVASNVSTVFTRNHDKTYSKVTMINNIPADELGQGYLNEMRTANNVMEMDYKQLR